MLYNLINNNLDTPGNGNADLIEEDIPLFDDCDRSIIMSLVETIEIQLGTSQSIADDTTQLKLELLNRLPPQQIAVAKSILDSIPDRLFSALFEMTRKNAQGDVLGIDNGVTEPVSRPIDHQFFSLSSSGNSREVGINFVVTDKCNITCDVCGPGCGPEKNGHLNAASMIATIEELQAEFEFGQFVFTGGEPTIYIKEILKVLDFVKGLFPEAHTRVVTNGSFARTTRTAHNMVSRLKSSGLSLLVCSVDDFHFDHMSELCVKHLADACVELELPLNLAHKHFPGSKTSRAFFVNLVGAELPDYWANKSKSNPAILSFSSDVTYPIGRNAEKYDWSEIQSYDWRGPCTEVMKRITVSPEGNKMPCCGLVDSSITEFRGVTKKNPGVISEHASELSSINESTLFNWLGLKGPDDIWRTAFNSPPPKLVGNCQACQKVFSDREARKSVYSSLPSKRNEVLLLRLFYEAGRSLVR